MTLLILTMKQKLNYLLKSNHCDYEKFNTHVNDSEAFLA